MTGPQATRPLWRNASLRAPSLVEDRRLPYKCEVRMHIFTEDGDLAAWREGQMSGLHLFGRIDGAQRPMATRVGWEHRLTGFNRASGDRAARAGSPGRRVPASRRATGPAEPDPTGGSGGRCRPAIWWWCCGSAKKVRPITAASVTRKPSRGQPLPAGGDLVAEEQQADDRGRHRGGGVHRGHRGRGRAALHGQAEQQLARRPSGRSAGRAAGR